jgi:amidase
MAPGQRGAKPDAPAVFAYAELDIASLQARMASGRLDSRTLTRAYLARIQALNHRGPSLHAILELNPHAMAEASALDAERRAGHVRGPLHGIPVLVKGNIDVTPLANSAGSLALQNHRPTQDADLVMRLRKAGAVILGTANLSEWANFRSTHASSGWSALGGMTRNPYALDHSACGSSSGTAVAVAANLAVAGIGTETDGSILCPAALNGVVGIKPGRGEVSQDGIIPVSPMQDTAGPIARSVHDAALVLDAIRLPGTGSPATFNVDSLRGARFGVLRGRMGRSPATDAVMERAITTLREAGAIVVDTNLATDRQWDDDEFSAMLGEFKVALNQYLTGVTHGPRSLRELIAFNRAHANRELAWFDQDIFERAEATQGLDRAARERATRLAGVEGIDATLAKDHLDVLIAPVTGPAWTRDLINGDHFPGGGGYSAAAIAGYPSLTVPMGQVHGLPVGLMMMANAQGEARLLQLADAFEQHARARRPPTFPTSVNGD